MKVFELYANGHSVNFNHIEDLNKNEIMKMFVEEELSEEAHK